MHNGIPYSDTEDEDPYHEMVGQIRRSDCVTFEEFDSIYNIDTSHPIEPSTIHEGEYRPSFINNNDKFSCSAGFQNTPLEILNHLNNFLSTFNGIEDYSFIDLGSGKGKVILYNLIQNSPYKDYIGVEIDKEFNDIALNNLETINVEFSKNVSFIESNVLDYEFPTSKCIYYLYYSFDENTFETFMQKNLSKMIESKSIIVFHFEGLYNFKQYLDIDPIYNAYKTKVYYLG
jgi:SAM-dependent methyltransferase